MVKKRREISLDQDIVDVVDEKTMHGNFCLSKFVNHTLRKKYKKDLDEKIIR